MVPGVAATAAMTLEAGEGEEDRGEGGGGEGLGGGGLESVSAIMLSAPAMWRISLVNSGM